MARIRTIKPEFFRHFELFEAERETGLPLRLAFIGLWTVCDREGRFKWRPEMLKVECLPFDNVDFSRVLDALATRGFIVKYASNDREFGHVPSFLHHQSINNKEMRSLLPEPTLDNAIDGFSRVSHALTTRANLDQGEKEKEKEKEKEYGIGKDANNNSLHDFKNENDLIDANPEKEKEKKFAPKKEKEPLDFPYTSDRFMSSWDQLLKTKEWKKKDNPALQKSLNRLKCYDESFSILLIDEAIERGWQGLVYDNTPEKYQKYLNHKNGIKNGTANQGTNLTARLERNQSFGTL